MSVYKGDEDRRIDGFAPTVAIFLESCSNEKNYRYD
jgi:hypothetical protein